MGEVLLIGGDLSAHARLESAAAAARLTFRRRGPGDLLAELAAAPPDVLVLDLDEGRDELLEQLERARTEGLLPARVLGYYSHVDASLGERAEAAGCRALPRGRFWRDLSSFLTGA